MAGDRSREEITRVLVERARALALPEAIPTHERLVEMLVVAISGERYALDLQAVVEAVRLRGLVPLPGTPSFVAGVILNQGRLLAVFDLGVMLDLPATERTEKAHVAVIEAGDLRFGILTGEVAGVVELKESGLTMRMPAADGKSLLVRADSPFAAVLDVEALAADPRIRINQELL